MKKIETLNRREVIKLLGMTGAGILTGGRSEAQAATKLSMPSSKKDARIVIVGAGTAEMIAAARIRRAAPNAKIIMIAPNRYHLYQSGQLFVAAGLASEKQNIRKTTDLVPDNVLWYEEKVVAFYPDDNTIEAEKSGKIPYDILVVALGVEYDWMRIEGLEHAMIGKEGIASVYDNDTLKGEATGGMKSQKVFAALKEAAQKRHIKFLCTKPDTPIKGEGTTLSMILLGNDMLKKEQLSKRVHYTFSKPDKSIFPSSFFQKQLQKEVDKHNNINVAYGFNLKAIDITKKKATYDTVNGKKELYYDFIHIVPPMKAPKVLADSPLAIKEGREKGWMLVEAKTLRHPQYKNIFGIGDILGNMSGKSAGAAQHQGIILQDNIVAALEGQVLPNDYDGYTVAPIITQEGKILLAEYNREKTLATLPLDPMVSRRIWWWLQKDVMPRAYFDLLMRGMM